MSASEALAPAPVVPRYGSDALCDVVPSLAASLGVDGWENVLGVPEASRWVLLLVDGLGDLNLAEAVEEAPFLGGLRTTGGQLTAGVPSTTATSITSLGTGLTPGQHGMLGYSFRNPVGGGLLNALLW
ncbi:MAG: alkaline phosphatase family protein, partial [Propioniciclava sp.]